MGERIHLDYAGPIDGEMVLVMVDAHSKWLEVGVGIKCTAEIAVKHLRRTFVTHGIPRTVVSDNGPCFVSEIFDNFCQTNGILHVKVAPYHPFVKWVGREGGTTNQTSVFSPPKRNVDQ